MNDENPDAQKFLLESVFVLHRHSIRSPTCYAPNYNEIHPRLYPRGTGYLTRQGIDICRSVAEVWRSWYPDHINGSDHRAVFARSSESPRCHETAAAILHAILSGGPEGLNPVPIFTPPPGTDKYVSCAGFDKDISEQIRESYKEPVTVTNTAKAKTMLELNEYIKTCFNNPSANEYEVFVYVDGIISNMFERLPLPLFFKQNEAAIMSFYHFAYRAIIKEFAPFYGFHLLQGMARRMKQVYDRELTWGHKWCNYSFHDFNISSVLIALEGNVQEPKPAFLGAIFFELLRNPEDGSHVVDVYYSSGLDSDGRYAEREPLRMRWNQNSHRVVFEKLFDKMYNNVFESTMTSLKTNRYVGDDAMV